MLVMLVFKSTSTPWTRSGARWARAYGEYDFLNTGSTRLGLAAALWHNFNVIQSPGANNEYKAGVAHATGINGAGDVPGYKDSGGGIAWANGAGAAAHHLSLDPSTPGSTVGYR